MQFDDPKMKRQFLSLDMCPYMFWKAMHMDAYCQKEFGRELTITSVYRKDGSSHSHKPYRAIDLRVRHPVSGERTLTSGQVAQAKSYHDKNVKRFGRFDSFFEHDVRGPHIHTQRPSGVKIA